MAAIPPLHPAFQRAAFIYVPSMSLKPGDTAQISKALDGRITVWGEDAERMFGYAPSEALGKHISIIIPFDFQDEEYEILDRLKYEGVFLTRQTVRRNKEGRFMLVNLSAMPVKDHSGKIIGALKSAVFVKYLPSAHYPRLWKSKYTPLGALRRSYPESHLHAR